MIGLFHRCHVCKQHVRQDSTVCSSCGAQLHISCPYCGRDTFIKSNCRYCRVSLYVVCSNKECSQIQLISPGGRCKNCGELIKN